MDEGEVQIKETVRGKAFLFLPSCFLLHTFHSLMPLCLEHFSFCCTLSVYKSKIVHFCTPYCYLHFSFVVHIRVLRDVYKFGEGKYIYLFYGFTVCKTKVLEQVANTDNRLYCTS